MKICPTCKKTYTDETLNFCLDDGAVLNQLSADDNAQPTILMGQPIQTNPNNVSVNPTIANPTFPDINKTWAQTNPPKPVKKSKTWIWVLGIIGVFVVLGGLGFIGIVALVASNIDEVQNTNEKKDPTEKSPTPVVFKNIQKDSFAKWRVEKNQYGTTEYRGGEYIMSSKQEGYYYVLIAADTEFDTYNASTKITVRNVNGTPSGSGYGILVHSDSSPLVRDFGFMIDSSKQSYRVVQHTNLKETVLVQWTRFPSIRSGTQTNELEVKDQNGKLSFYVNGQFANSVEDSTDFSNGVYGLYVSDAIPIAFSNLQIGK